VIQNIRGGNKRINNTEKQHDIMDEFVTMETYHVHRNILAIGERRSGYFANLFHYGIDDGDHCTNVELSARAATYFPDLLDYMYDSKAFTITTQNAAALLFLAQAFQVTSLQSKAEEFIERDIRLANFGCYMSDALYFSDEKLAFRAMDAYGKEVLELCSSNQTISKILRAPISSSVSKAEEKCKTAWTFLTGVPKAFASSMQQPSNTNEH
jgi:hypothetical protein